MSQTRRAQILMRPDEYRLLEEIAARQGTSVAELFRSAVRKCYLSTLPQRMQAAEEIAGLQISLPPWETLEQSISEAHDGGIP
jgi:hypothetical protein